MTATASIDIEANLRTYLADHDPAARYASFDYCFNHFQDYRDRPAALVDPGRIETSCLHLGFYLASWGMFRGSSELLQHSLQYLRPVVETIAAVPATTWTVLSGKR